MIMMMMMTGQAAVYDTRKLSEFIDNFIIITTSTATAVNFLIIFSVDS